MKESEQRANDKSPKASAQNLGNGKSISAPFHIQSKLTIGSVNDPMEQEADVIADKIAGMPEPLSGTHDLPVRPVSFPVQQSSQTKQGKIYEKEADEKMDGTPLQALQLSTEFAAPPFPPPGENNNSANALVNRTSFAYEHEPQGDIHRQEMRRYEKGSDAGESLVGHDLTHVIQQAHNNTIRRQEHSYTPEFFLRSEVENVQASARARSLFLEGYVLAGSAAANRLNETLRTLSSRYGNAYSIYSGVIDAAGREARNQDEWVDIIFGIAIGVVVGLTAGAALPAILGAEAAATAASRLARKAAAEGIGEGIEAAAGGAIHNRRSDSALEIAGVNLRPSGINPALLNSSMWESVVRVYQSIINVNRLAFTNGSLIGYAEFALRQIDAFVHGTPTELSETDLLDWVGNILSINSGIAASDDQIRERATGIIAFRDAINQVRIKSERQIESDIWVMWIASLSFGDSNILDLDAIEDHLEAIHVIGSGSRLGVDFGGWTSTDDEREAITAARRINAEIEAEYRNMMAGNPG